MKIALFDRKNPYFCLDQVLSMPEYRDIFDYRLYSSYDNIIEQYEESKDAWDGILFTGPVGYGYFMEHTEKVTIPVMHLTVNFEGYYMVLLDHLANSSIPLNQVYMDTQNDMRFIRPLRKFLLPDKMPQILVGYDDFRDDLPEFIGKEIKKLWDAGKIKMAYVSMHETYEQVVEAGIPCNLIKFDRDPIIKGLDGIKRQAALSVENGSSTVCLVIDFLFKKKHELSMDEIEYRRATMFKILVDFKKEYLQGIDATVQEGTSRFVLIISRKDMDVFDRIRFPLNDYIAQSYQMDFAIGGGVGNSMMECLMHAEQALEFSRDFGSKCIFVAVKNLVIGPLNRSECLEIPMDACEKNIERAKLVDATPFNFTRCEAMIERYEKNITSVQVAKCLNITERSANRIISKLVEYGVLEHQDTKNYNVGKGRPTKRYRKGSYPKL